MGTVNLPSFDTSCSFTVCHLACVKEKLKCKWMSLFLGSLCEIKGVRVGEDLGMLPEVIRMLNTSEHNGPLNGAVNVL